MNYKKVIISSLLLTFGLTAGAQQTDSIGTNPFSTVAQKRMLPLVTSKIRLLTRSYGDSIVLRWAAEDYVSYKYLADFGVNVLRVRHDSPGAAREPLRPTLPTDSVRGLLHIDTLAYALKPLTLEQFRAKYAPDDSVAMVPQGLLYGDSENYKPSKEGTMTHNLDLNAEQDIAFGFAMLTAEWRKDLAEDMAVRLTDRSVESGVTYDYYVQPTRWENGRRLIFEPGVVEGVECKPFEPEVFNPRMTDSISTPHTLTIGWWDDRHSSYEIERRQLMTLDGERLDRPWERINDKPYVPMVDQPEGESYCLLGDSVPYLGLWEYRIRAYDAFGDLSLPSHGHEVMVPDVEPPVPPVLKRVIVERPDGDDPMARVIAHIFWEKPDLEPDLVGYIVSYRDIRSADAYWRTLNDEMIPPTDTVFTADMTGCRTGMLTVSAYDHSGNEGRSFLQQINLTDYKAPAVPDSVQAVVLPATIDSIRTGAVRHTQVLLTWQQDPADDDIVYWDVAFANDSIHPFLTKAQVYDPMYIDTLRLDVNQKYIYYRVRAVDYSNNFGQWCPWIQVLRPHVTPPTQPHIDKSERSDSTGMHMEWIVGTDADMLYHLLWRRVGEKGSWQVIGRYDADSLQQHNYTIRVDDNPPFQREQRYYYMVESYNTSPYTSRSMAVDFLHQGPKVWTVKIELAGDYMQKEDLTRLVWTTGPLPFDAPYYYCVYRRGSGSKKFRFMVSQPADKQEYTDELLREGEQAEYYVMIQWRDGRQSTASNTVTVREPR